MNYENFKLKANNYLSELQLNLESANFNLKSHWDIDHICYRTDTNEQYLKLKTDCSKFSKELIESEINGRPITTFLLDQPIKFNDRSIHLLELPAPKKGKLTVEGFEHIEIVCDENFNELRIALNNFEIKTSGLSKDFNQELAVNINGSNIKFHHISLHSVVTLEANKKVFDTLVHTKLLDPLKAHNPLVVGTYPLGIYTEGSDLDIILETQELEDLAISLKKLCGDFNAFKFDSGTDNDSPYISASFNINGVLFELFGQNIPVLQQRAFKHFNIEERLLKIGGPKLKKLIMTLRAEGLKTEPAFAKVLNLPGDPYVALLELYLCSEQELRAILDNAT